MFRYAVLIDAGFLRRKLGSREHPMDAERVAVFIDKLGAHPRLAPLSLHRVYYYDAPPLREAVTKPLNGGRTNFADSPQAQFSRRLHAQLAKQPFISLRLGELAFRGWEVANRHLPTNTAAATVTHSHLKPNIQQKGVDMRIGLDIASLTLKRHVDVIVLVTGDSDFVPAMKFARREGTQLFLVTLGHRVREDMFEHADLLLDVEMPESAPASGSTPDASDEPSSPDT